MISGPDHIYYRHFKGKPYRILHIAFNSETLEDEVVYQALYGERKIWVRPFEMFFGDIERDGYCGPRFIPVEYEDIADETGRLVVFDFDGTLADTSDGILATLRHTLTSMGLPIPDDREMKSAIGLPLSESLRVGGHIPESRVDEAVTIYRRDFDSIAFPKICLFDGVKETLSALKEKGCTLAIATSRGKRTLDIILKDHGIFDLFDYLATSNGDYRPKPNPDMVLHILEKTGFRPDRTLVVGDTSFDLLMGKGASCLTCGVTYGNHDRQTLLSAGPDYIADSFGEILSLDFLR